MEQQLKAVYLVGGAVRDQLLGRQAKDKDYVVVGETPERMKSLGFKQVGVDFPVFLHPSSQQEYALARTEKKQGHGYSGFSVDASKAVTLEQDLARRDLTINSMAIDAHGQIVDPFNGQSDLQKKVLRHTTDAFIEDPLRVLRIARFLARFGPEWSIHPGTLALIQQIKQAGELQHLVAERVWQETANALMEPWPHLYFQTLLGLELFPELEAMTDIPQPPKHHPEGDVLVHTMLCIKRAADLNLDLATRFAVLCHDMGKASCYEKHGNLYGHEQVGVPIIKKLCKRLKVPVKIAELATLTSDNHTRLHKIKELNPSTLYKLLIKTFNVEKQPIRFEQFLMACQCDAQGRGPSKENEPYPQANYAREVVQHLLQLDKKQLVKLAIEQNKQGPNIGEFVQSKQLDWLKQFKSNQAC